MSLERPRESAGKAGQGTVRRCLTLQQDLLTVGGGPGRRCFSFPSGDSPLPLAHQVLSRAGGTL